MLKKFIPKKLKKLNRNVVLAGSLTAILLIIGVVAFSLSHSKSNGQSDSGQEVSEIETAETTSGKLTVVEGVVEFKAQGNWEKAQIDQEVIPGTSIRTTGAASRAEVKLEDGSAVRIDANTEVKLETLTEARVVINQHSGYVYNRVTPSEGRTYIVHTEKAQFQAAGTSFRTARSGDEEAVEVFHSSVRETTLNLQAQEGEKLTIENNADSSKNRKVEKLDIEALKKDSFIIWNRELDLKDEAFKKDLGFLADFDGPKLTITNPVDGATIEVGESDTKGSVQISGTVDRGSKLTVQSKSVGGSAPAEVTVDEKGNFTTGNLDAALGRSVFEFIAIDKSGNKTTSNVSFTFNKKAVVSQSSISLTFDDSSSTLKFGWILDGLTTPDGVMLVYGKNSSPTLDADGVTDVKVSSGNSYELKTKLQKGTYHFRVCRYNTSSDTCDIYSNDVSTEIK